MPLSFLHGLNTLPVAVQVLLPQRDLVVAARNSQNVAAEAPADAPYDGLEGQHLGGPLAGRAEVRGPDADRLVLGGRGDVALLQHRGTPGDVADPVGVAGQGLALHLVAARRGVPGPDLEQVVAAARDEAAVARGGGAGG